MFTNLHGDFIKDSLINLYADGLQACNVLSGTIDNYPLREYCLQSLFIRMTGAQEQKLRCILWELASYDLQFRYDYLSKPLSVSSFADKNKIYKTLINSCFSLYGDAHAKENSSYRIWADMDFPDDSTKDYDDIFERRKNAYITKLIQEYQKNNKENVSSENIRNKTFNESELLQLRSETVRILLSSKRIEQFIHITNNSIFEKWCEHDYFSFKSDYCKSFNLDKLTPETLLPSDWTNLYSLLVYAFRNNCAHNVNAFRCNLPTLDELCTPSYSCQTYFYRFLLLLLIDEAFVRVFERYMLLQKTTVFYT